MPNHINKQQVFLGGSGRDLPNVQIQMVTVEDLRALYLQEVGHRVNPQRHPRTKTCRDLHAERAEDRVAAALIGLHLVF